MGAGLASVPLLALAATPAAAHEVGDSRFAAPVPFPLLLAGAAATVAATALRLARADRHRDAHAGGRTLLRVPASVAATGRAIARAGFLLAVGAVLVVGLVGPRAGADNVTTVFTWPVWFRGLALVAVAVGSPWPALSPWRTLHDLLGRLEDGPVAIRERLPVGVAAWTAVLGFVVLLGVLEPLTVVPTAPRLTVTVVAAYAAVVVGGAVVYGADWLRQADPLAVFYRLLGRVSPVTASRGAASNQAVGDGGDTDPGAGSLALRTRAPWRGCTAPVGNRALVVFVVALVYSVSFDGFTATTHYQALLLAARDWVGPVAPVALYVAGLAGFLAAFALVIRTVERLGGDAGGDRPRALRAFAPTVLPIAAAYEVAHNYPFVLRSAGRLAELLLDAAGLAPGAIDPLWWLSVPAFWGSQVLLIVGGHVVGVIAAHRVARRRYRSATAATRAHLPLVALMMGYTVLSLWIVSQPVLAG